MTVQTTMTRVHDARMTVQRGPPKNWQATLTVMSSSFSDTDAAGAVQET